MPRPAESRQVGDGDWASQALPLCRGVHRIGYVGIQSFEATGSAGLDAAKNCRRLRAPKSSTAEPGFIWFWPLGGTYECATIVVATK